MGIDAGYGIGSLKPGVCTTATRPASPFTGQLIYDTTIAQTLIWSGSAWVPDSKVVQIVTATHATSVTNTTSTFANTGLNATITPTSSSNKILVFVNQNGCLNMRDNSNPNIWMELKLLRVSTDITNMEMMGGYKNGASNISHFGTCAATYLDSPATTSSTNYKTMFRCNSASTEGVVVQSSSSVSFICLMEVTP